MKQRSIRSTQPQEHSMFSKILVPTDGSPLSLKAAHAGAELAKKLGATLTAVYVIPPFEPGYAGEGLYFSDAANRKEYVDGVNAVAQLALDKGIRVARETDVNCHSTAG